MDGDFGALREVLDVADATARAFSLTKRIRCSRAVRMVGELLSTSALKTGFPLVYGTFSKAFGALGGFVAGSKETLQYLRFYAHPYVYSCALPSVVIAAILKALELGRASRSCARNFGKTADYFHAQLRKLGLDTGASTTYVMPIVIGDRELMYRLGHELRRRGLWVAPVDYPAVRKNRICFRACVTAKHTRADLGRALNILEDTLVPSLLQKAKRLMMSQQVETRHSRIAATYKAREVEGAIDVYFYRPLGFRLAEFFAHLKLRRRRQSAGGCLRWSWRTSLFLP